MNAREIIIRPIVTEKTNELAEHRQCSCKDKENGTLCRQDKYSTQGYCNAP